MAKLHKGCFPKKIKPGLLLRQAGVNLTTKKTDPKTFLPCDLFPFGYRGI
jgi:hypothetical protein